MAIKNTTDPNAAKATNTPNATDAAKQREFIPCVITHWNYIRLILAGFRELEPALSEMDNRANAFSLVH